MHAFVMIRLPMIQNECNITRHSKLANLLVQQQEGQLGVCVAIFYFEALADNFVWRPLAQSLSLFILLACSINIFRAWQYCLKLII